MKKRVKFLFLCILFVLLFGCAEKPDKPDQNIHIVTNGVIPDRYDEHISSHGTMAYLGDLATFEDYFFNSVIYDKCIVLKGKKKTSKSYYNDYGKVEELLNSEDPNSPLVTKTDYTAYTLTDIQVTEIVHTPHDSIDNNILDNLTIVESYSFEPDGRFFVFPGYKWPILKNDNEYLLFLFTGDDNSVTRGNITVDVLDDTWVLFASFVLDDEAVNNTNSLTNDEVYYGPYLELYKPIFKKYLNMEIDE